MNISRRVIIIPRALKGVGVLTDFVYLCSIRIYISQAGIAITLPLRYRPPTNT